MQESGEVSLRKVWEEVAKLGINSDHLVFDHAHRIGAVKRDQHGKVLP